MVGVEKRESRCSMKEFAVSADLDISAQSYFLEKDSVAFRCLLAQVPKPCMHTVRMHKVSAESSCAQVSSRLCSFCIL